MQPTMTSPRYRESGSVARRLNLSLTRLLYYGKALGLPAERTDGGRRLWTEEEVEAIQRLREERLAGRAAGRDPQAA